MKGLVTIIIIIAIAVVAFFMFTDNSQTEVSPENSVSNDALNGELGKNQTSEDTADINTESKNISDSNSIDTTPEVIVVTYNNNGFSPKEIVVSQGQTVRFVNESSGNMWVGSAVHPDHTAYSGTSLNKHCPDTDKTAFDQCETGDMYEFTFTKIGEWGYHNHIKPSAFGKVIVK